MKKKKNFIARLFQSFPDIKRDRTEENGFDSRCQVNISKENKNKEEKNI